MKNALIILGALIGGLSAKLGGAILGGIVGFVLENTFGPETWLVSKNK